MRLLDTYATNTGSTIDKPYIYTKFFPIPEKYITIQAETPYNSRNYSYWEEVIDIIKPILDEKKIKIVQVGKKEESPISGTVSFLGLTDLNQLAYIINNSILHFGADSLCVHLASHFDKPIVSIYSISNPNVAGPHFGNKNKHKLVKAYENIGTKKPSYSKEEDPKSIDTVKPEELAKNILELIDANFHIEHKTLSIGGKFKTKIIEFIPDGVLNPEFMTGMPVCLRIDLCENVNEYIIFENLKIRKLIFYLNNKNKISKNLFSAAKQNIVQIIFDCTEEQPDKKYLETIIDAGYSPVIFYKGNDINYFNRIKIDLIDFNLKFIHQPPNEKMLDEFKKMCDHENMENITIKSNRLLLNNGNVYISEQHFLEKKPTKGNTDKISNLSNIEGIKKDLDFLYFYAN